MRYPVLSSAALSTNDINLSVHLGFSFLESWTFDGKIAFEEVILLLLESQLFTCLLLYTSFYRDMTEQDLQSLDFAVITYSFVELLTSDINIMSEYQKISISNYIIMGTVVGKTSR